MPPRGLEGRLRLVKRLLEDVSEDRISIEELVNALVEAGVLEDPYICSDPYYDFDCISFTLKIIRWIEGGGGDGGC